MRVSREEMARSHQKIVESASRLLRERGLDGAGVSEVMSDAGLTHGGFYRHFETKDALLSAALEAAFGEFSGHFEKALEERSASTALAGFRARYLSAGHVASPGVGCPAAAVAGEVARSPDGLKATFGAGVNRMLAALARCMGGSEQARFDQAARELATLVGAVTLARASDKETAGEILRACRAARR
jgi:TetR/AcrR family transcriptional repressor of nem operon